MSVTVFTTWKASHSIEPPDGESDEAFEERLENGDQEAWDYALDQTNASTAELTDWGLRYD